MYLILLLCFLNGRKTNFDDTGSSRDLCTHIDPFVPGPRDAQGLINDRPTGALTCNSIWAHSIGTRVNITNYYHYFYYCYHYIVMKQIVVSGGFVAVHSWRARVYLCVTFSRCPLLPLHLWKNDTDYPQVTWIPKYTIKLQ